MTAQDYPITTPYGYVPGYPLNNGYHNGIDYGCPEGTPVVVNGVQIGLSGATGYVSGPHLHVGRWVNGVVANPGTGGFGFQDAVVTEVASDSTNGKYVRVQADGASWVYLHLSQITCSVGQQLMKGTNMDNPTDKEAYDHYKAYDVKGNHPSGEPTQADLDVFVKDPQGQGWKKLYLSFLNYNHDRRKEQAQVIADLQAELEKAGGTISPELQAQIDRIDQNTLETKNTVQKIWDFITSIFKSK